MQITRSIRRIIASSLLTAGFVYPACAAVCPKGIGGCPLRAGVSFSLMPMPIHCVTTRHGPELSLNAHPRLSRYNPPQIPHPQ